MFKIKVLCHIENILLYNFQINLIKIEQHILRPMPLKGILGIKIHKILEKYKNIT